MRTSLGAGDVQRRAVEGVAADLVRRAEEGDRAAERPPQHAADPASAHWVTQLAAVAQAKPRDGVMTRVMLGPRTDPAAELGTPGLALGVGRRPRSSAARRRLGLVGRGHLVGQRELHDRAQRLAVLPVQRPGGVRDVVLVAQRPHLD